MLANRVSFFLGLTGTSLSIDTGDNAGGVILEEAVQAIKEGQCDNAIVGSCYLALHPHVSLQMSEAGTHPNFNSIFKFCLETPFLRKIVKYFFKESSKYVKLSY